MNKKQEKPENNIQFVGRETRFNAQTNKRETVLREAPAFIVDGRERIDLPESADQQKGFFHEDAARIMALFPQDYKKPQKKG